jgi:DNA polymerase III subunit delta'
VSVFDRLTGQGDVAAALAAAARGDGMTHAWLFTGPPGSGRSVAARAFAAALLCADGGCDTCASCGQVRAGSHPNLTVFAPTGLSIKVADTRELIRRGALASAGAGWRVVLIEDADRLGERAANALLKAIEEPEPGLVFLLCAPSPEDLLPTIRSRCRQVGLRLPSAGDVAALLELEGVDPAMAAWAAQAAQGHVGRARGLARDDAARRLRTDALALPTRLATLGEALAAAADLVDLTKEEADRRTGVEQAGAIEAMAEALGSARGSKGVLSAMEKDLRSQATRARRDQLDRALVDLAAWYRDVLALQLGSRVALVHADQGATLQRSAAATSPEVTLRQLEAVLACREAVSTNVDPLLAVEELALTLRAG